MSRSDGKIETSLTEEQPLVHVFTDGLDEDQNAVLASPAPCKLVLAGPGSGKTKTLVAQAAYWAACHGPHQVAVLTYTVAAAREVQGRLARYGVKGLGFCGTLHAFCLRLIREHAAALGFPEQVAVMDDAQRLDLAITVAREMGSKSSRKGLAELMDNNSYRHPVTMARSLDEIVAVEYHRRLRRSGLLDFGGVLYYGLKAIELCRQAGKWPWQAVLVDEYQDASDMDAAIYHAMPCAYKFLVGDDFQAIYQFRGGNPRHLLGLAFGRVSQAADFKVFMLQRNYRSGAQVCGVANRLIAHNQNRSSKITAPMNPEPGRVAAHDFPNAAAELAWVQGQVQAITCNECNGKGGVDSGGETPWGAGITIPCQACKGKATTAYSDIAVIARTNRLAYDFAAYLQGHGIPVAKRGMADLPSDWQLAKLLISVLAAPWNDLLVHQYLCATLGRDDGDRLRQAARLASVGLNRYLGSPFGWCDEYLLALASSGDCSRLNRYIAAMSPASCQRIAEAVRALSKAGEWDCDALVQYLASEETPEQDTPGVTVCTAHASKGREWAVVFVVGMEEGAFPQARAGTDMEEERRLAFVAFTRAKERLEVTWCHQRVSPFGGAVQQLQPSRFIQEAGL